MMRENCYQKWRIQIKKYKIKQKIRNCINTYKKQGINVYRAWIKAFNNETIIAQILR